MDQYGTGQYGADQSVPDQSVPDQSPGMVNNILRSVTIQPSGFYRANLPVEPGTTVQWNNVDTKSHTVTSDDGAFDSGEIRPGQTFNFKFDEPGRWHYHSELDPDFQGTIIVGDARVGASTTPEQYASDPTQTDSGT
ncbi:MAG: cupredoxin domain-containing protein [Actinomycetota bacterium]|nr:cupredoxin domain-containing protein [Actinomycetota bacterium]